MTSIYSNKIPVATAVAFALGAVATQPVLAQSSQAGKDQASSAIQAGPVTLQFGGFVEAAAIYRNREEQSDVVSDFGGLPLSNTAAAHEGEYRESARQSRISLLAQAAPYNHVRAEAYFETDFLSAGVTSNSRESNSYTLRLRHAYADLTWDSGFQFLGGQTWSLATLTNKAGMGPRDAVIPLTIDGQYVVGFNWTRAPQFRFTENFSKAFAVAVSVEEPQAVTSGGNGISTGAPNPPGTTAQASGSAGLCGGTTDYFSCGDSAGLNNNSTTYSQDTKPDVIVKAALDPGYGHYEVYGLARFFESNPPSTGGAAGAVRNVNRTGGGVGAGALLPLVPDILQFQLAGLAGRGIGRYASGQLTDIAERPDGTVDPIKGYSFLSGLTLTPNPYLTVYAYYGREMQENNFRSVNNVISTVDGSTIPTAYYGYGSPFGSTQKLYEITVGQWYKFYQGVLGNAQIGLQGAYVQKDTFTAINGTPGLEGNIFIGMVSFRYYPYQR